MTELLSHVGALRAAHARTGGDPCCNRDQLKLAEQAQLAGDRAVAQERTPIPGGRGHAPERGEPESSELRRRYEHGFGAEGRIPDRGVRERAGAGQRRNVVAVLVEHGRQRQADRDPLADSERSQVVQRELMLERNRDGVSSGASSTTER